MNAPQVHMPDEEKVVDAEVQEKKPDQKLTRKEKKEKLKKKTQKKHSSGFWMFMMILFVVLLALGVYLPDYLERKTAADTSSPTEESVSTVSSTPSAFKTPVSESTSSPKAEKTALPSPAASIKAEETAPPVPSMSSSPSESANPSSGRIYTTKKKETLQMIAEKELGDINLWKDILKENQELGNIDGSTILKEGIKLYLPEN